jgi:hypothetical protein
MRVLGSVVVGVGVVVLDMFVLVAGVRVRVSNFVVAMFVRVCFVVTVLMLCHCHPLCCRDPGRLYCALRDAPWEQTRPDGLTASCLVCIPRGARGVEQCAWASGARAPGLGGDWPCMSFRCARRSPAW